MASRIRKDRQVGKTPTPQARDRDPMLPHDQDQDAGGTTDHRPDPVIEQAYRDIERGLVDTDLHATPGLDAARREQLLRRSREQSEKLARGAAGAKKPKP